jgi:Tfp pilus assembly protein PilV
MQLICFRPIWQISRHKPSVRAGLSLPDMLVAMAILSVVLLGMMQLYGHIRGQMIRTEAALIAQQRAELTAGYALAAARKASLRHTNFSAGTHTSLASCYNSNSNICEPNEYGSSDEDYLQITGSAKGHGLWNDKRTDQG